MGLPGITIGFTCGSIAMGIFFYITITCFCNWEEIAKDIRKKMKDSGAEQKEGFDAKELKTSLLH